MRYIFKGTKKNGAEEGIFFDSDEFTREEAESNFTPYSKTSRGRTEEGLEYDGQKYKEVEYIGKFDDFDLPCSDAEVVIKQIEKVRKSK